MITFLVDGDHVLSIEENDFPKLATATPEQLANYRIIGDYEGIHWPDLDEDISIERYWIGKTEE